jgi:Family of unknown function (DUF6496)
MPTKEERELVKKMKAGGMTPSQQAGEFVRREIEQIRDGEHGAANAKQAIAIGLSEARRAGVDLPPPKKGKYDEDVREQAKRELAVGDDPNYKVNRKRSMAARKALKKEPTVAASKTALSRHAKAAARARTPEERSASAKKAAATRKRNAEMKKKD